MIYPSIKSLLQKVDNKYSLVVIAAKRSRQLVDGKEPYVKVDSNNPVTISTNEINTGLISYKTEENSEN